MIQKRGVEIKKISKAINKENVETIREVHLENQTNMKNFNNISIQCSWCEVCSADNRSSNWDKQIRSKKHLIIRSCRDLEFSTSATLLPQMRSFRELALRTITQNFTFPLFGFSSKTTLYYFATGQPTYLDQAYKQAPKSQVFDSKGDLST